jgi:hypothetical protein
MKLIVTLIALCFLSFNAHAQRVRPSVLKKNMPSVFVSADKVNTDNADDVVLKLTNNSRFKLGITFCHGPSDFVYIIDHRFEDKNHAVRKYGGCHVGNMIRLSSGRSVRFAVDREELLNSYQLAVPFNYEWESWGELDEPKHFVYILSATVFESIKKQVPVEK